MLNKKDLIGWFETGCKKPEQCLIGMEHEMFVFDPKTWRRVPYQNGISRIFDWLKTQNWQPILENGQAIAMTKGNQSITLEPGGQFELSGAPHKDLHQVYAEFAEHLQRLQQISKDLGLAFVPMGFDPVSTRDEVDWMPKDRYVIMRHYMPTRGQLGLDMMLRTCTVQANLDYVSEPDMVAKMRLSMALQPIISAIFAASPFKEKSLNGYQTYRQRVWQDTDPDRCGFLDFVFNGDMGFERYVDYLLDVPMYFTYRKGYIDRSGHSFRDYMATNEATLEDWADHTTTAFPEVRLKKYLEMRGADASSPAMMLALPAIWTGLLYVDSILSQGLSMIQSWSIDDMRQMYKDVPAQGLSAFLGKQPVLEIAREVLRLAEQGLRARGLGEEIYLEPLLQVMEPGQSLAQQWLLKVDVATMDWAEFLSSRAVACD